MIVQCNTLSSVPSFTAARSVQAALFIASLAITGCNTEGTNNVPAADGTNNSNPATPVAPTPTPVAPTPAPVAPVTSATMTFINSGQLPESIVGYLFVSASDDPFFGVDRLGNDVLSPGQHYFVDLPNCDREYDYLLESLDGLVIAEEYNIYVPCDTEVVIEVNPDEIISTFPNYATIHVFNAGTGDGSIVAYFYARPVDLPLFDIDWLGNSVLYPGEAFVFETNECNQFFNFYAEGLNFEIQYENYDVYIACGDIVDITINPGDYGVVHIPETSPKRTIPTKQDNKASDQIRLKNQVEITQ